jgi:Ca2+/Na+ antiporter
MSLNADRFKKAENLHIIFWLIKDTCWMLDFKWLGAAMIAPTLGIAIYFIIKTKKTKDVFINAAVFFWILANSYWMSAEFFFNGQFKYFASIPFALGFLMVIIFYWQNQQESKKP